MLFKDVCGERISALGFGAMRLPTVDGERGSAVDEVEAARIIEYAYNNGVNYFDTAYMYHGGESERIVGRILKRFPRESFFLATKFPGHEIREDYDAKAIFEEQLEKCGVDYFDFYLLHNVSEGTVNTFTDPKWGIIDYLLEQKRNGRIRHLGLSAHAKYDTLKAFLDEYGEHMEFCQLQMNYVDWVLQGARERYELLTERKIPVWVMEPVRGGKLAKLPDEKEARLRALRPDASIASWCFNWLLGRPNVKVILSGMSTMEQVEDNIKTFTDVKLFNEEENELITEIADELMDFLPCTSCRYCCTSCPAGLDIPALLSLYNECRFAPSYSAVMNAQKFPEGQRPENCVACGNCKRICPQGIDIPEAMRHFNEIIQKIVNRG